MSTVAVIMTHVGGITPTLFPDILALDVPVISDCAQALGSTWKGGAHPYGMRQPSFKTRCWRRVVGALLPKKADWLERCQPYSTEVVGMERPHQAGFVPTYERHISGDGWFGLGAIYNL